MNVYPAYLLGYTGNGSNAVVLDDGLDTKHHDLKANYDPTISINLDNGNEDDPRGPFRIMKPDEAHGTQCAGLIAAVGNNEICSHGIAYHAKIGVVRMLSGKVNDIIEARSLSHNVEKVAMYCASWGPTDDGFTMDKPRENTEMAMKYASIHGRNNHGTLLLFASGNGGAVGDHCGADGFVSSPHVIAIAALDHQGARTMYSESCSGTRVAVPVGSPQVTPENPADLLPTTTENNKCVLSFMGTSAAAPLAAGCFALALEARPEISKRDFENLLPWSARIPTPSDEGWIVNAAGILYNSHAGYGLLDCTQLVQLAKQWHPVGPLCIARSSHGSDMGKKWAHHQDTYPKDKDFHSLDSQEEVLQFQKKQKALRKGRPKAIVVRKKKMATIVIPIHKPTYPVGGTEQCTPDVVEKVIATFQWSHICRGTMSITLKSPSQTRVLLLGPRSADYYSGEGSINITSVAFWGEDVYGDWTIEVSQMIVLLTIGKWSNVFHRS
ncbi:unnamed protein product [Dicrocoelium dendriticum]|nr:unnamed protein product [Dicrocoelium dendriticum]